MTSETVTLSNGSKIPKIGYGSPIVLTYMYNPRYSLKTKVKYWGKNALKRNRQYRTDKSIKKILEGLSAANCSMIDTSRAYAGSEQCIGKMLKNHKREDFYIVTKLCNKDQLGGTVREALQKSLRELGTDYVDLYLMHWPVTETFKEAWKEMEKLYNEGLCRAIGVANFNIHHLEELSETAAVMPMVNQIECHPLFTQNELRAYCNEKGIKVMAYTPTARMDERLKKTALVDIAKKHNKSMAQVILRWHIQLGNIPVVNTSNSAHLKENFEVFDFALTDEEMRRISAVNINSRLRYDPDNCDFSKL